MNKEEMNQFLESIGGLEYGWGDHKKITDCRFFGVGEGWYPIIKNLIEDLIKLGWNKEIVQVKEKFGGLRFYITEGNDEVFNRITEAEKLSYETCEITGKPGKLRTDIGWYLTLCDEEYEKKKIKLYE